MASAKRPIITKLDQAAHRLGINLAERGINRRLLTLYYANVTWDITDDGDKLKIRSFYTSTSGPHFLWEKRQSVEYVIAVMEAIARRSASNVSGTSIE
jgi:hypothetical protein